MRNRQDQELLSAQMDQVGMTIKPALVMSRTILDTEFAVPDKIDPFYEKDAAANISGVRGYNSDFIEWRREPVYRGIGAEQDSLGKQSDVDACLWKFRSLQKATAPQVIQFAKKYGVLGIWPSIRVCKVNGRRLEWTYREPIGIWQDMAKRSDGIFRLAASLYRRPDHLRNGEHRLLEDWHKVFDLRLLAPWFRRQGYLSKTEPNTRIVYAGGKIPEWVRDVELQKALLEYAISLWLGQVTVKPRLFCSGANSDLPYWTSDVNCSPTSWDENMLASLDSGWGDVTEEADYDAWDVIRLLDQDESESMAGRGELGWNRFEDFNLRDPAFYGRRQFRPSRLFNVITLQLAAVLASRDGRRPCKKQGCRRFAPERTEGVAGRPAEYCSDRCREADRNEQSRLRMQKARNKTTAK